MRQVTGRAYFKEAINTVEAGSKELWAARIFGKRVKVRDGDNILTFDSYKGKTYLVNCNKMPRLKYFKIGKFIYSNCAFKHDIMFNGKMTKYLFWNFWWEI